MEKVPPEIDGNPLLLSSRVYCIKKILDIGKDCKK